jgi:hypothetical protein
MAVPSLREDAKQRRRLGKYRRRGSQPQRCGQCYAKSTVHEDFRVMGRTGRVKLKVREGVWKTC